MNNVTSKSTYLMTFSKEQLIERRNYLNGSECAAALGMSSFFTPLQLYKSKKGEGEVIETTIPMMVGQALEPVVLELFERETGWKAEERQQVFLDESTPYRRCTIDGYVHSEAAIVEAKTSGDWRGWGEESDEIPLPYIYNLHHYFSCIPDAKKAFFPVLIGGRTYQMYTVHRDETLVDLVKQGEERFWEHVRKNRPPQPRTLDDIKLIYPRDNGQAIEATPLIEKVAFDLARAKADIKEAAAREDAAKLEVCNFMREFATLRKASLIGAAGQTLVTWNTQERTTVDLASLRAKYPAIANECAKTTTARVLLNKIKVPT